MGKDSAARIELGRSFHQMGTVNEKVSESDFVPLWDGIIKWRSLSERKYIIKNIVNKKQTNWLTIKMKKNEWTKDRNKARSWDKSTVYYYVKCLLHTVII